MHRTMNPIHSIAAATLLAALLLSGPGAFADEGDYVHDFQEYASEVQEIMEETAEQIQHAQQQMQTVAEPAAQIKQIMEAGKDLQQARKDYDPSKPQTRGPVSESHKRHIEARIGYLEGQSARLNGFLKILDVLDTNLQRMLPQTDGMIESLQKLSGQNDPQLFLQMQVQAGQFLDILDALDALEGGLESQIADPEMIALMQETFDQYLQLLEMDRTDLSGLLKTLQHQRSVYEHTIARIGPARTRTQMFKQVLQEEGMRISHDILTGQQFESLGLSGGIAEVPGMVLAELGNIQEDLEKYRNASKAEPLISNSSAQRSGRSHASDIRARYRQIAQTHATNPNGKEN